MHIYYIFTITKNQYLNIKDKKGWLSFHRWYVVRIYSDSKRVKRETNPRVSAFVLFKSVLQRVHYANFTDYIPILSIGNRNGIY